MNERTLNYFSYYTEIEDTFIRRRGKHIWLSATDWALIETWKEMGIPLHVALRGVEKAFDSWEAKPRKRSVKTLLYCEEEVEAQYAEWLDSRVGAGTEEDGAGAAESTSHGLPFPRPEILAHLQRVRSELLRVRDERLASGEDELSEALARAGNLLVALEREFSDSSAPDAKKLEDSLTGLERLLSDAINCVVQPDQLDAISGEVKDQLKPYRRLMEKSVYKQTFDNLQLKRLREHFAVPRLSLFHL